mmetsp:Transcript_102782/g.307092  ORF Transcript_102782/g.307092 Transcript_102782/m.307092 type:complete len:207 (-) Transcript_102782:453-1073(-)
MREDEGARSPSCSRAFRVASEEELVVVPLRFAADHGALDCLHENTPLLLAAANARPLASKLPKLLSRLRVACRQPRLGLVGPEKRGGRLRDGNIGPCALGSAGPCSGGDLAPVGGEGLQEGVQGPCVGRGVDAEGPHEEDVEEEVGVLAGRGSAGFVRGRQEDPPAGRQDLGPPGARLAARAPGVQTPEQVQRAELRLGVTPHALA